MLEGQFRFRGGIERALWGLLSLHAGATGAISAPIAWAACVLPGQGSAILAVMANGSALSDRTISLFSCLPEMASPYSTCRPGGARRSSLAQLTKSTAASVTSPDRHRLNLSVSTNRAERHALSAPATLGTPSKWSQTSAGCLFLTPFAGGCSQHDLLPPGFIGYDYCAGRSFIVRNRSFVRLLDATFVMDLPGEDLTREKGCERHPRRLE